MDSKDISSINQNDDYIFDDLSKMNLNKDNKINNNVMDDIFEIKNNN